MKIEKLIIYGFGKHENVTIDLGPRINVLYGLNEAGKTTIQQFILHILFGFPQRNSAMLRYEPKSGGKYGGQIVLTDDVYGQCVVERIRGKSAGDVTVYFEDGETGGEEALSILLRHYDRASFESIFSFSLLQLQGFEKMDEEELSRTLLASGTTGVDSLLRLEKQMEKERGDLFKKSGKNPEMNVKMKALRELELELKAAQDKMAEYSPAIERIQHIDEQLSVLREEEKTHEEQVRNLSLLRQYLPLQQKKKGLERRLQQVGSVTFPSDGIRRFESITEKQREMKATERRIKEELAEIASHLPQDEYQERITEFEILLAKETEWHGWRAQIAALEDELRRLTGLKRRLFDRLGMQVEDESVLYGADVSIRKEEEMHELMNEMTSLNNEIGFVETQFEATRNELHEAQLREGALVSPSNEEINEANEWPSIRQQLAEAKAYIAFGENRSRQSSNVLPFVMLLAALLLIGFGVIQQQWLVVIAGVIVGGIGVFLYPKKEAIRPSEFEEMQAFVATYSGKAYDMEQLIARIEAYKRERERLEEVIRELTLKCERSEQILDDLLSNNHRVASMFETFISDYGFDGLPSPSIVPELFRMIREVQEVSRDMEEVALKKRVVEENMARRIDEVETVLQQVVPPEALYELLRREFIRLTEEVEKMKSVETRRARLNPALKETVVLLNSLEANLRVLLEEAGVETEEAFYHAYDGYQEILRFSEQLADIETQLKTSSAHHSVDNWTDEALVREATDCEVALSSIHEQMTYLIEEKAALVNKTEQLLTDETYATKRQLFEMKKAELAELAKKWSARTAVVEAIKRTMHELKEEKLPKVLKRAERLFSELTGGKYEELSVTGEGYFEVTAMNGMRYPIVELSQATKEQAYISLRFALASSVLDTAPLPIIMDDPFVHFDDERLSRMIRLLHVAQDHQFIYFTCHQKMKDNWTDAEVITI